MSRTISQQAFQHHMKNEPHGPQKSSTVNCPGRAYNSSIPDATTTQCSNTSEKTSRLASDVDDRKLSQTSLPLATQRRRRQNVLIRLKRRAAWLAKVVHCRLSWTNPQPFTSPTRRQRRRDTTEETSRPVRRCHRLQNVPDTTTAKRSVTIEEVSRLVRRCRRPSTVPDEPTICVPDATTVDIPIPLHERASWPTDVTDL